MADELTYHPYKSPTGGWGSVKSLISNSLGQHAVGTAPDLLRHHNKLGGYACTSCAWAKPAKPHTAEFCENGAKATFWDLTSKRTTPEFFAKHTVAELLGWADHDLENEGRLTHPMRYDRASDTYRPVEWEEAFAEIGTHLKGYDPESVVFYASGRASLETSYMYALLARLYGNNNLPDSSNMCHETTSVALPQSIGTPVGTVLLEDFEHTDCILSFGQNVGTNSPRLLHPLQEARKRGAEILVFNPLRERGWEEFANPQKPGEMLLNSGTQIATQYHQVRTGGDIAAMVGVAKALFALDDDLRHNGASRVVDIDFITEHTHGFEAFEAYIRHQSWDDLEREAGLDRTAMEEAATAYARSKATIAIYGMGLTQHRLGVDNVQMLVNLMLMRGNIGKPGAGMCPIRGHSNVQGQRTVGISEKTELVPLEKLAKQFGFSPPMKDGMNTVEACEGILDGRVKAFISLGGNFVRAIPDTNRMEAAWRGLDLSVQVATKLNRSHLVTAGSSYILPCLVRTEIDEQARGKQVVTVEDSTACIHASRGVATPARKQLLSEPAIVAGIATATLAPNPDVTWDEWVGDYGLIRDAIATTYPDAFHDFNDRLDTPGGFPRPIGARQRKWETKTGKANFVLPKALQATFDNGEQDVMRLMTIRSNDQFNTTIYGYHDRLRGIDGSRMVVMMNEHDMERLGLNNGDVVGLETASDDGVTRRVVGLRVLEFDVPRGCVAAYYPETNPLVPLYQYAEESKTPAAKSVPVRVLTG